MSILKAIVGAAIAGLGSAATAVTDGHIGAAEWIAIATTTLAALYGVWQTPNAAKPQPLGGQIPPTTTGTSGNVKVIKTGEQGGVLPPPQ